MLFTTLSLGSLSAPALADDPTTTLAAVDVSDVISNQGPRAAVDAMTASPGRRDWMYVMRRIETGSGEWLSLAPELVSGATANAAAELRRSLAYALLRQPSTTLRLISADINVDYLCTAPLATTSPIERRKYIRETLHALSAVADPDLWDHRSFCVNALQQVQQLSNMTTPRR